MKRRYTVLFLVALSPLIGLSWFAAQFNVSVWITGSISMYGLIGAAAAALYALLRRSTTKIPAVVAFVASLPMAVQLTPFMASHLAAAFDYGPPLAITIVGAPVTCVTALCVALLPAPASPREPQVAPARVERLG